MHKSAKLSDKEQVNQHTQNLEPGMDKIITYLRKIILSTDKQTGERIKWNNPGIWCVSIIKHIDSNRFQ